MKKLIFILLTLVLVGGLFGCAPKTTVSVVQSQKSRDKAPQVAQAAWLSFIEDNNAFALDLYRLLKDSDRNVFFSPYSISLALAMAYAGARGQTAEDMSRVLHYDLSPVLLHPAFNRLAIDLANRGKNAAGKDGKGFRLNIANATWGQQDYQFLTSYLDILAVHYGAGLRLVDFINKTEQSRLEINRWVADQTAGKIKDLIPAGALTNLTRLVLTNAVYFNAAWLQPFEKELTVQKAFYLLDGSSVPVAMMNTRYKTNYAEGAGYRAVEIPYDGRELSMIVILPDAGKFAAFENSFDAVALYDVLGNLADAEVTLGLPKFEFDSEFNLKQALTALGMANAFGTDADFSGINGQKDLYITDVLHKAYVAVDEAGTEAAAATAVIVGTTSVPARTAEMIVNRPFLFLIRDNVSGSVIFLGRVVNPVN